ncbi:hypothetical protein [Tsuneonella suprasediminis]|uniref:hypothetical protein n=1 Tax=Tsuneonella suprasediminis TaxID=2306996 RepID=UPI002F91C4D7
MKTTTTEGSGDAKAGSQRLADHRHYISDASCREIFAGRGMGRLGDPWFLVWGIRNFRGEGFGKARAMSIATIVIALILIVIAWKVLMGVVKFGAIAVILLVAVYFLANGGLG